MLAGANAADHSYGQSSGSAPPPGMRSAGGISTQLASQVLLGVPFAAPSSHSSPHWTTPSPQVPPGVHEGPGRQSGRPGTTVTVGGGVTMPVMSGAPSRMRSPFAEDWSLPTIVIVSLAVRSVLPDGPVVLMLAFDAT